MMRNWATYKQFGQFQLPAHPTIVLASGPQAELVKVWDKLRNVGLPFIFSVDTPFHRSRGKDTRRAWHQVRQKADAMGLRNYLVRHAEFGGATSTTHQIVF